MASSPLGGYASGAPAPVLLGLQTHGPDMKQTPEKAQKASLPVSAHLEISDLCEISTLPDILAYLEVSDLCDLDATSSIIVSGVNESYAWIEAAGRLGLLFEEANRASIKMAIGTLRREQILCPSTPLLLSKRGLREVQQISAQMRPQRVDHVCAQTKPRESDNAGLFIALFSFSPEVIQAYLDAPCTAVTSTSVSGRIKMSLTWHRGEMFAFGEADFERLRALLPPHQECQSQILNNVPCWCRFYKTECKYPNSPDFVRSMERGILCIGVRDFNKETSLTTDWSDNRCDIVH